MGKLSAFYILILFLLVSRITAQENIYRNFFSSPIDTVIKLSGNFGELRSNHFHGGIDIKTNNREGMKVLAVGDGYVSKIRVSSYGYGKMLFITHPNGLVSDYAHLLSYNDTIQKYVRAEQYKNKTFEIELKLKPGQIPVKKGDFIALSGNTGASEGPHLHFEIRDTSTEIAYNPLLFGFEVEDHTAPAVQSLMIYPADKKALINNINAPKKVKIIKSKGKYNVAENILVQGKVYFGIETFDSEDNSAHKNGLYSMEMLVDEKKTFSFKMDTIPFGDSRCINSHIDYQEKLRSGRTINRCCLDDNNFLGIYHDVQNRGMIDFNDSKAHDILFYLKDYFGNTTELSMQVKSKPIYYREDEIKIDSANVSNAHFECERENRFRTGDFSVELPTRILYEDIYLKYSVSDSGKNKYSAIHRINDANIPIHDYFDIAIKTNSKVKKNIQDKLLIVNSGGTRNIKDCFYEDGFVKCKARTFGDFKVVLDTTPPVIKPLNIKNRKDMSKLESIKVFADDNLSGIKHYSATIDGKWVLMEHEHKKKLLYYTFEGSLAPGMHFFELDVTDERGNVASYKANFTR